jgi:hypothetical protein
VINTIVTSNKSLVAQQKDKSKNLKKKYLTIKTRKKRVPNPLSQISLLMVTKEKNCKVRRLTDNATFVGNMVIMCNFPDLDSLGNVVNVYVGSIVYNI